MRRPLVLVSVALFGLVGCGGDDDGDAVADASTTSRTETISTTTTTTEGTTSTSASVETTATSAAAAPTTTAAPAATTTAPRRSSVSVRTVDFAFEPRTLRANAGPIDFAASNEDGAAHTFTVTGTDVNIALAPNGSGTDSSTLAAGTYEFVCSIHGSMTGTLTVA